MLSIVLHSIRVSDKSTILHLLTRDSGKMIYTIYGRGNGKNILFTPLTILDIEPRQQAKSTIPTLRDYSLAYVPEQLQNDIRRTTCALFIAEILYRTLFEPYTDEPLFTFVRDTVINLDTSQCPTGVHVKFLIDYISYLGFAPDWSSPDNSELHRLVSLPEPCSRADRHAQLDELMIYYHRHLPDFVTPKSLDVLKQVFD